MVGRDIADELDWLVDALEQATPHLVIVDHIFYRPGDVVFRIAQQNVRRGVGGGSHFDQVVISQHLVLAAVLHQDIEIGVHQRRLVAIRYLEGCGPDTETFIGLLFLFRVFRRVYEFDTDPAFSRDCIFPQQVL